MLQWIRAKKKPQAEYKLQVAKNERIYAVGDVHGRADLLRLLLDKISQDIDARRDSRMPRLIFLGDYVDRGDHSREVLEMLAALRADLGSSGTFLRGNHEAAMMAFLADPEKGVDWLDWGGVQTVASFGIQPPRKPYQPKDLKSVALELEAALGPLLDFVRTTDLITRSGDHVFCHAGIDPAKPLDDQPDSALLWGTSAFLQARQLNGIRVVHGHYDRYEPDVLPHRIGLDTGAYYSGRLTGIRLDDEERLLVADVMDIV